jgi:hypothetical protein
MQSKEQNGLIVKQYNHKAPYLQTAALPVLPELFCLAEEMPHISLLETLGRYIEKYWKE